jgi:hypothetical protein
MSNSITSPMTRGRCLEPFSSKSNFECGPRRNLERYRSKNSLKYREAKKRADKAGDISIT